ncbi:MAG: hypothetical protein GTN70_09815 [Deltaproteobacteria bacterium]|nr:hypothetical protein [Deltaproteobacteria bacterium]NIS78073.1 hypothetical protein [Deltaproteobacteria bacterium]
MRRHRTTRLIVSPRRSSATLPLGLLRQKIAILRDTDNKKRTILNEIAGGFGDIGVLIPITLALVIKNGFDLRGILLSAGIFYVGSALFFRVPMPVQPLKAMAAVALAQGLPHHALRVAGLAFAAVILLLLIPGVADLLERLFSLPVVRGIQLALGIMLVKAGVNLSAGGILLSIMALALLSVTYLATESLPPILPVLIGGLIIAGLSPAGALEPSPGLPVSPGMPEISIRDLSFVLTALIIPQLGLTIGNSVMATAQTAKDLFSSSSARVNTKNLTLSITAGNFLSCLISGIPMCHGAGGLTAHYRFGARSNRATLIAGGLFLLLALLPSGSMVDIFLSFPLPFLGILLIFVGGFHASLAKDCLVRKGTILTVLVTAAVSLLCNNLSAGALAGILFEAIQQVIVRNLFLGEGIRTVEKHAGR